MTYHAPRSTMLPATTTTARSSLPQLLGSLAHLRTALADKQALIRRVEADWVADAERETARHIPKHVQIDDRSTWGRANLRPLHERGRTDRVIVQAAPAAPYSPKSTRSSGCCRPPPPRFVMPPSAHATIHPSITVERVCEAVERHGTSLDDPGFCTACGAEAQGVEPRC